MEFEKCYKVRHFSLSMPKAGYPCLRAIARRWAQIILVGSRSPNIPMDAS